MWEISRCPRRIDFSTQFITEQAYMQFASQVVQLKKHSTLTFSWKDHSSSVNRTEQL